MVLKRYAESWQFRDLSVMLFASVYNRSFEVTQRYGYSSRPGIKPEIVIRSITVKGEEVSYNIPLDMADKVYHQIEVHDNGIGFDQADSERIFTVFTLLHSDLDYRGSGIGLSIVKKVVAGHQGFVWATSVPGNRSVF